MKRPLILAAGLALAAIPAAQSKSAVSLPVLSGRAGVTAPPSTSFSTVPAKIATQTQNSSGDTTLVLDISGTQSWDALNDPSNTVLTVPLGAGASMTGIGWDVNLATVGGSWLSEARFYFDGSDQDLSGLFLTPGAGNSFSGSAHFANPVIDLTDVGIPDIPILADGNLYIQLNESFDDVNDAVDANWNGPSTLTIVYDDAAAVPTVGQWGLIGLGVVLLGGVVVMSLRRGTTRPAMR